MNESSPHTVIIYDEKNQSEFFRMKNGERKAIAYGPDFGGTVQLIADTDFPMAFLEKAIEAIREIGTLF